MSSAADTDVFIYEPHSDDLDLSQILIPLWYGACGYPVHRVTMTNGQVTPESIRIGGGTETRKCVWHGYLHDPEREGYTVPTIEEMGQMRIEEAQASLRALSMFPTNPGTARNTFTFHEGGLADGFGGPAGGSPTAAGIAAAQNIIQGYVDQYPGSLHFTMSPTDDHPDHAACGQALRNLKNTNPALANSKFTVSRLYWDYTKNPDVLAQPGKLWFGTNNDQFTDRKSEMDTFVRQVILPMWMGWRPDKQILCAAYHQVGPSQFQANLGAAASIGNLTHL